VVNITLLKAGSWQVCLHGRAATSTKNSMASPNSVYRGPVNSNQVWAIMARPLLRDNSNYRIAGGFVSAQVDSAGGFVHENSTRYENSSEWVWNQISDA
jgi:hypothetical protein